MSEERLIIVDITNGKANTTRVHLPATRSNKGGFRFDTYQFPPATWPAACGNGSGHVYVHTGPFEHALVCRECRLAI